jgi:hypothetical protein
METKTQNLAIKIGTYTVLAIGVILTIIVMKSDNPAEMNYEQEKQWAINEVKENQAGDLLSMDDIIADYPSSSKSTPENWEELQLNDVLVSTDLNAYLNSRTSEIRKEKTLKLDFRVDLLIWYSIIMLFLCIGFVLLGFGYLAIIDTQKALRILTGVGVFTLFVLIVFIISYFTNGEEELKFYNDRLTMPVDKSDILMAKMAILSTIILIAIAMLGWLGSPLFKYFRK